MTNFAQRLKELRNKKDVSLDQVANSIDGINKGSLSRYENGKSQPGIEATIKLADYFNCSLDYLTGRSDYINPDLLVNNDFTDIIEEFNQLHNLSKRLNPEKIELMYSILDAIKRENRQFIEHE